MNEKVERAINFISCAFSRVAPWCLWGESLAYYACSRILLPKIELAVFDITGGQLMSRLNAFQHPCGMKTPSLYYADICGCTVTIHVLQPTDNGFKSSDGKLIRRGCLVADEESKQRIRKRDTSMSDAGMWNVQYTEQLPYQMSLPFMYGTILDVLLPLWWTKISHKAKQDAGMGVFFDGERKKNADDLLQKMYACGKAAGIDQFMFPGFGTTLGIVRGGDYIPHDRDMDMCILADKITREQDRKYVEYLEKARMFEVRRRGPTERDDTGRYLWCSLGPKSPVHDHGVKSCNWWFFEHSNYMWHTKGDLWVTESKFDKRSFQFSAQDKAICKGIPAWCFKDLIDFNFHGISIRLPYLAGSCCDFWYPNWGVPAGGSSLKKTILVIGKWRDKKTWRVM